MEKEKNKIFKGYSVRERKNFPFVYICLALPLIHIILFYFVVNLSTISYAFKNTNLEWSFESFRRVFESLKSGMDSWSMKPLEMLKNSVIIWVITNIVSNVINIFMAYFLTKHMIGSKLFRAVFYIPSIVGPVLFSAIMKEMYAYNGVVVELIKNLGIDLKPIILKNGLLGNSGTAFKTLMIQLFVMRITGADMILGSAYMKIPEEIFESAKLEGCGFFREAFQIAIPLVWPTVTTMMTFALCSVFTADYSMYLYSNGSGANGMTSIGFYLYQFQVKISGTTDTNYLMGYVSAFGVFITLITVPVVILGRKVMGWINQSVDY